jgi:hypothetical protein
MTLGAQPREARQRVRAGRRRVATMAGVYRRGLIGRRERGSAPTRQAREPGAGGGVRAGARRRQRAGEISDEELAKLGVVKDLDPLLGLPH